MAQLKTKKLSTKGTLTITENDTNIFLDNTKVYSKYVVVGVWGQSNAVGYDESFLTKFDIPVDEARIFQYSDSLKPLTFCAENLQNMNTVPPRSGTASEMSSTRAANDSYTVEGRTTYVKTKGIHLPLANLICSVIPEDYGVIIVPGAYGGKGIAEFIKTASSGYYTEFVRRLNTALALHEDNIFGGIVWCQGENNTGIMSSDDYITNFSQIITNLHTDILTGNEKKMPKVAEPKNYWFAYEFPVRFKRFDSTGILAAQKTFLGNGNYVEIPDDTPHNTTLYTSQHADAHYASDSFRTVIAPRVFAKMNIAGMFATGAAKVEIPEVQIPEAGTPEELIELIAPGSGPGDASAKRIIISKQHLKSGKIKSITIKMGDATNIPNNGAVYLGIFQQAEDTATPADFSSYVKLGVSKEAKECPLSTYVTWEFDDVLITERRILQLGFLISSTDTSPNKAIQMKCNGRPTGDTVSFIRNDGWTGNSIPLYTIVMKQYLPQEIKDADEAISIIEKTIEKDNLTMEMFTSDFFKTIVEKVTALIGLHPGDIEPLAFSFKPSQVMCLVNYKVDSNKPLPVPSLIFADASVTIGNGGGLGLIKFTKKITHFEATVKTPISVQNSIAVMIATDGQAGNGVGFFINPVSGNKTCFAIDSNISWNDTNPGDTYTGVAVTSDSKLVMDIAADNKVTVKLNDTIVWDDYVSNGVGGYTAFNTPELGLFTSWKKGSDIVLENVKMSGPEI